MEMEREEIEKEDGGREREKVGREGRGERRNTDNDIKLVSSTIASKSFNQ